MSNKHEILSLPNVMRRTGLSRSTLYAYIARKEFPSPIRIGIRKVGWLETDINSWIEAKIEKSKISCL